DGAALVSAVVLGRTDVAASAASVSPSRQVREDAVPTPPVPTPLVPTPTAPAQPEPEPASRAQGAWSRLAAAIPAPDLDPSAPPEASLDTLLPRETTVSPADASPVPAATTTGYDELWGATVLRSVEDAAVRPDEDQAAEAPAAPAAADRPGDHDGQTVSVAQLRALRGDSAPAIDSIPPLAPARPSAPGRLRVSNGQSVLLDRTVIVGRRPRSTRVAGTDLPHLVAVDSPQQDISRSHVEFRVEGDSILVTDLHTTNGTMLVRPGAAPARLHPGEATVAVAGDVIDLGDGITVAVEALS
ncbi:MAG TPA: FHA domain-containing protein, partial [Microbacterium sp.]|uniref:FHA domain-containing protein n=1 Tax=Microbacterium sp. TaxID=51671 RepID=UPI002B494BC2